MKKIHIINSQSAKAHRVIKNAPARQAQDCILFYYGLMILLMYLSVAWSNSAFAAKAAAGGGAVFAPAPILTAPQVPPQFDITGFIQEATLDSNSRICQASDPRLAGGTVKVNGITVIIPCNTILQMPAATLTWQELFSLAPRDIGLPPGDKGIPSQTGMAQKDTVNIPFASTQNGPLPSYEIHVQGNIVNGKYIAGLCLSHSNHSTLAVALLAPLITKMVSYWLIPKALLHAYVLTTQLAVMVCHTAR